MKHNETTISGFHPLIIETSQARGVFYSGPSFKVEKKNTIYVKVFNLTLEESFEIHFLASFNYI